MTVTSIILWRGTKICQRMGVDPEADQGLIRYMLNMLVYLVIMLAVMWMIFG
jgi:hypothetical protein